MTDDTMAALRETLLDRLLRFTTRTDLSVTACVEGDIRPAGKARSESHPAARCAIAVPQHRRGGSGPEILDLEQRAELTPGAVGYNERARSDQRLRGLASRRRRPAPAQRRPRSGRQRRRDRWRCRSAPSTVLVWRAGRPRR